MQQCFKPNFSIFSLLTTLFHSLRSPGACKLNYLWRKLHECTQYFPVANGFAVAPEENSQRSVWMSESQHQSFDTLLHHTTCLRRHSFSQMSAGINAQNIKGI